MNRPCLADWDGFTGAEHAVLCFVRNGEEVLLIEKLRGLGSGKVNAPGGKIEPGESALDAAVRETEEEVGVTPVTPAYRGTHRFAFSNGYRLVVHVFLTSRFHGEPRSSAEAIPFWCPESAIPFQRMWEDDRHWLPEVLAGRMVQSWMTFDEERMTCWEIAFDGLLLKRGTLPSRPTNARGQTTDRSIG